MRDKRGKEGITVIGVLMLVAAGFILIIVIIGILSSIAIPKFAATREYAYFSAMKSDLNNLASHEQQYYSDHQTYAGDATDLAFSNSQAVTVTISNVSSTGWAASATHSALDPSTQACAIYYGSAAAPAGPATPTEAGQVLCAGG